MYGIYYQLKIMNVFDHLPPVGRFTLLKVAQAFSSLKATNENKQDKAENVL